MTRAQTNRSKRGIKISAINPKKITLSRNQVYINQLENINTTREKDLIEAREELIKSNNDLQTEIKKVSKLSAKMKTIISENRSLKEEVSTLTHKITELEKEAKKREKPKQKYQAITKTHPEKLKKF
jgi:regulator of replication initiation timing